MNQLNFNCFRLFILEIFRSANITATLINAFIVPTDKEEEFLENWKQTTDYFSGRKGFIETFLHRNAGVGNQPFMYINLAKWESKEVWSQVHSYFLALK